MNKSEITNTKNDLLKYPEKFRDTMQHFSDVLQENGFIINAISELSSVLQIYIALVDNVIEMKLNDLSNSNE